MTFGVYDLSGRRVAELVSGRMPLGHHSVRWDGTDGSGRRVAPGIYHYRLRAGALDQGNRAVIMR